MEEEKVSFNEVLDQIVTSTFARHAGLPEGEYMEKLGIQEPKDEDTEVREARFSLLTSCTREVLKAVDKVALIEQTLKICLEEKKNGRN